MTELMDRNVEARTMTDLAGVHARHGSLDAAVACYERGLAAIRALGDYEAEIRTMRDLDALRELVSLQAAARS